MKASGIWGGGVFQDGLISIASCSQENIIPGSGIGNVVDNTKSTNNSLENIMLDRPGRKSDRGRISTTKASDLDSKKPIDYSKNDYNQKENSNSYAPNNHLIKDDLSKPESERFNNVQHN